MEATLQSKKKKDLYFFFKLSKCLMSNCKNCKMFFKIKKGTLIEYLTLSFGLNQLIDGATYILLSPFS